jgi:hypothetical protein
MTVTVGQIMQATGAGLLDVVTRVEQLLEVFPPNTILADTQARTAALYVEVQLTDEAGRAVQAYLERTNRQQKQRN